MPTANSTMDIREVSDGIRVIDVQGEITALSEEQIRLAHEKAGKDAKAVILNFEGLEYMNSGGIGLLVTTLIRAQRVGHSLRAYGLSDHYQQIFTLTRLDEAIGIYHDEASAIAG